MSNTYAPYATDRISPRCVCPICSTDTRRWFASNGFWIRRCVDCCHCFAEVSPELAEVESLYDDDYFFGGGVGYPNYIGERDLLIAHGRRYGKLLQKFAPPATVLDVGAAAGFVLEGLRESGWKPYGVEPNLRLAEYAREQFGIDISVGTIEELSATTKFDLVTMIQVVGHLRDVRRSFAAASTATRPNGLWLVETWNYGSLTARLLGKHWAEWSPPSVLQWFTLKSLTKLCAQFGMRRIAHGRPRKYLNGQHAKSLLRYKLTSRAGQTACWLLDKSVPDRATIRYPADDVFWMLLQKRDDFPADRISPQTPSQRRHRRADETQAH